MSAEESVIIPVCRLNYLAKVIDQHGDTNTTRSGDPIIDAAVLIEQLAIIIELLKEIAVPSKHLREGGNL